jgi:hypothetical protein
VPKTTGFATWIAAASAAGASVGFFAVSGASTLGARPAVADLPKGAHAGECFARATTPAVYRTERQPVASPPLISYRDIPAVYRTLARQVLIAPGRVDHETVPAVTGSRVRYIDRPGPDRVVETPAVYRWEVRKVLVRAAHLEWREGHAARGYGEDQGYGAEVQVRPTGEVMCRVLVPARYDVRRVRVLVTPAHDCIVKGPVIHERTSETYVVRPARTIDHPVAPIYRTISEQVLASPARRERIVTPAPPHYVEKRVEIRPAATGWTRIACKPPAAVYRSRPVPKPIYRAPVYRAPVRGGQCHTHTVCEDVPYAEPRPGAEEPYVTPTYQAPQPSQDYGSPSQR